MYFSRLFCRIQSYTLREAADAFLRIPVAISMALIADRSLVFHCGGSAAVVATMHLAPGNRFNAAFA
jgi:hypothetical protein